MNAAPWPRDHVHRERLLVVDPTSGRHEDVTVAALSQMLGRGDVLVVNDAATLPASLQATTAAGTLLEVRIAALHDERSATCVLFGKGDWRTDTDLRPAPPSLVPNDVLSLAGGVRGRVTSVSSSSERLVELTLLGQASWSALAYAHGAPVQYAYLEHALPVALAQTPYASVPWAVEMPSAGRALSFSVLRDLAARGVHLARLRHAAGLSATGDAKLDALLPLPERYSIAAETVGLVEQARARGKRVVAVGTTVVRALEGCFQEHGRLVAGEGITDLILDRHFVPRVTDGVLAGMHERGTSHAKLLSALAPAALLDDALTHAEEERYLVHEFGDHLLVLPGALSRSTRPSSSWRGGERSDPPVSFDRAPQHVEVGLPLGDDPPDKALLVVEQLEAIGGDDVAADVEATRSGAQGAAVGGEHQLPLVRSERRHHWPGILAHVDPQGHQLVVDEGDDLSAR